ncbi:hypothetical protein Bca101_097418 [Brassica carinata]
MVEVFCVCGEWSSKETFQWEFVVDKNTTASFINLEEDLQYEDLLKMISEDFRIQVEDITLSYEISLELKSTFEDILESYRDGVGESKLRAFVGDDDSVHRRPS